MREIMTLAAVRKPAAVLAATAILAASVALETPATAPAELDAGAKPALEAHPHAHHPKPYEFKTLDYIGIGTLATAVVGFFGSIVVSGRRHERKQPDTS